MKINIQSILINLVFIVFLSYWLQKISDSINNLSDSVHYTKCTESGVVFTENNNDES